MGLSIIVAVAENGVIGRAGTLPWRLSADLQRFKRLTWGQILIMGRRTYDSIGRPLPGRTSIVLTHRPLNPQPQLHVAESLATARTMASSLGSVDTEVFVIGGRSVFEESLPLADRLYWTQVHAAVEGDVVFPAVDWTVWEGGNAEHVPADARNDYETTFQLFTRRTV